MDETHRPTCGRLCRVSKCRTTRIAIVLLLTVHATLLAWQARRYSPTIDEPAHLAAGINHWKFGRFDLYRVNPPLVRLVASLPMLLVDPKTDWSRFTEAPDARPRHEFAIGAAFARANGIKTFWHFTLARWACIPFSLIGGYVCYRWARDLYGTLSGIVSLVLWSFCPNILGNGALITPDVSAAALGVMAGYFFWRWLSADRFHRNRRNVDGNSSSRRSPQLSGWARALLAGLTLGLAELTKSTWIILFGLWPVLWVMWTIASRWNERATSNCDSASTDVQSVLSSPQCATHPRLASSQMHEASATGVIANVRRIRVCRDPKFVQLAAILLVALYVLNFGYFFENSFQRLDKFQFISHSLGGAEAHIKPGNRFANTWLGALPVPVPANYLSGLDVQRYDFEVRKWSYLRGEQKMGGWWYYYLYAMFVKMPLGTLFLIALAAVLTGARVIRALRKPVDGGPGCASRPNERDPRSSLLDNITLLAPALALLVVVSSQTGFNRYLRYVVPAFPFLFIWASQVARAIALQRTHRFTFTARLTCAIVILPLLASIASSLAVVPHSLCYFNEFAGGPENGPAHLLDANVDWGQDLLDLKHWYDEHPEARPFYLEYFSFIDPRLAGLEFKPVPGLPAKQGVEHALASERGPVPGWHAISINPLYGYKHIGFETDRFAYLRQFGRVTRIGYSTVIYHVTTDDANRLRRKLGLDELP